MTREPTTLLMHHQLSCSSLANDDACTTVIFKNVIFLCSGEHAIEPGELTKPERASGGW